jgi:hypothetical protein
MIEDFGCLISKRDESARAAQEPPLGAIDCFPIKNQQSTVVIRQSINRGRRAWAIWVRLGVDVRGFCFWMGPHECAGIREPGSG